MAVAALSTSALALAAGPVPAPATPGAVPAPEAFAKLVERAKSDDKPAQDGTSPEASADGETESAVAGDEATVATAEGEAKEPTAIGTPVDLLARINAMVEAASQIGINVPAPIVARAPETVTAATPEPAVAVTLAPAPAATPAAAVALPVIKPAPAAPELPVAQAAPPVTSALPVQQPAPIAVAATEAQPVPVAAIAAAQPETVEAEAAPAETALIVRPAVLQRGSDIAQLLASLRSAFGPLDGKEAPAPAPTATVPNGTIAPQPAVVPAPVIAAPKPVEAALPQVAVIAAAEAPIPAPTAATAAPFVVDQLVEEGALQTVSVAPQAPDAPVVASAAPKTEAPVAAPKAETPVAAPQPDLPSAAADQATPPADAAPAVDAPADRGDAPATPATTADAAPPLPTAAPAPSAPSTASVEDSLAPATAHADQSVDRQLDLVRDNQWLDRLARDISQAATRDGQIRFQLNPEHLGALTVEIANSAAGTAIRMTADTDQARAIIADAQPRLLAEVRAQGLRVAESHVDLNQQQSNGGSASAQSHQQQQQNRQTSEDSKPFVRTQTGIRDDADDSAARDDGELYA